jgi:hypothetical protein
MNSWLSNLLRKVLFPAPPTSAAFDRKDAEAAHHDATPIRSAGREAMRDPPQRWSKEDEESDASFPASDPPGNY